MSGLATDRPAPGPAPSLRSVRGGVERELERYLRTQREAMRQERPGAQALLDEIERLVRAGGKRVRPTLCVLGHLAAGGAVEEPILRAAAALELLHTFALIHDDLMDRSPLRRGVAATHVLLGGSGAVLAGDMALVLADDLLLSSGFPPGPLVAALRRYSGMRLAMGAGQFLDLRSAAAGPEEVARIAALKSGDYSVAGPLEIGALLTGAEPGSAVLVALARFGAPLGSVFQLRDDVRGVMEDRPDQSPGQDLARGRPNALVAAARDLASEEDVGFLDSLAGRDGLVPEDLAVAREILVRSGAVAAVAKAGEQLLSEALDALERLDVAAGVAGALRQVALAVGGEAA